MDNQSFSYYTKEINSLIRQVNDLVHRMPINGNATDILFDRIVSLCGILKNACNRDRLLEEIKATYNFSSRSVDEGAWVVFTFKGYRITRAEALRYSSLFDSMGMTMYHIEYGINERVSWAEYPVDPRLVFMNKFSRDFNLWVSPAQLYLVTKNSKQTTEVTQEMAQAMFNELTDAVPSVQWVVRYGPNDELRITTYDSGRKEMTIVPLKKDATPEEMTKWLKDMYNYDNDDWDNDEETDPHDANT